MTRNSLSRRELIVSALVSCACHPLDVTNPNDPDFGRALADPVAVEAVAAGALRTWFNAYTILDAAGALSTQARAYSAPWNGGGLNLYSSVDVNPSDTTTPPDTWTRTNGQWRNDPLSNGRTSVEAFWSGTRKFPGFYSALSSAADALRAIRRDGIVFQDTTRTRRVETIATFVQGAALMMLALNYDKGFIVDETADAGALDYANRKQLRDAAITKLLATVALADGTTFTTNASWANGVPYTSAQISQIARTMAAITLAWYPRDASESATQVDWLTVANHASSGMSSGTAVDFAFVGTGEPSFAFLNDVLYWCNALDICRVSTRVAHLIDPSTQRDPYPLGVGNAQPNSLDRRLGDGSFGVSSMVGSFGNVPRTANAGTDFAWSANEIFDPARGFYHQSNLGHIRYDESGVQSPTAIWGGAGYAPVISATVNDLLWAEALLRLGGANVAQAVALINKTRVGRGGLNPAIASDPLGSASDGPCMSNGIRAKDGGPCTLFSKLLYEYEIELLGLGALPFYNQRRLPVLTGGGSFDSPHGTKTRYIQGLIPGTPREMPVPHTELILRSERLYTWGGAKASHSPAP